MANGKCGRYNRVYPLATIIGVVILGVALFIWIFLNALITKDTTTSTAESTAIINIEETIVAETQ